MRDRSLLPHPQEREDMALQTPEEVLHPDDVVAPPGRSIERLRLLWDERHLLGKATAVGMVLGLVLAFLIPKHYQSTVQLMPPDAAGGSGLGMMAAAMMTGGGSGGGLGGGSGGGGGSSGSGLGAIAGDLLGLKNTGAEFVGILGSRTVEDRLIDRFDLLKVYHSKYREDARKELSSETDISEDRKSGIITIEVTDKDPQRAAAIAQAYVEELDRLSAEVSTSASHRERVFLEQRLQEVKLELSKSAVAFSQFASKNTTIDVEEQGKAMVEAAAQVQGQLIGMEADLKGLEQIYTPNNPRVRSAQGSIAELRAQLQKLGGGEPGQSLQPGEMYPSIRQLPVLGVSYYDLYRNVKIQEAVYETLTSQYEMAKVEEVRDTPSVKVLDSAVVPETKSFPPRFLVIALCMFFAGLGTVSWVLARVRWERTDATDPGKVLALEVLESVNAKMPWSTPNGSRFQAMTHKAWVRIARRSEPEDPSNGA
jgi:capsule polysaccharide export protein KpsE/RkpR